MRKDDPDLKGKIQELSFQFTGLQNYKKQLNEKKASLAYEERQLANILSFIESHEKHGVFLPETNFCEEEIMLLLEQVRVMKHGYVVSFKAGRVIEVIKSSSEE